MTPCSADFWVEHIFLQRKPFNHDCSEMLVCTLLVQTEISENTIELSAIKFCTDLHGPQRMNPNDTKTLTLSSEIYGFNLRS